MNPPQHAPRPGSRGGSPSGWVPGRALPVHPCALSCARAARAATGPLGPHERRRCGIISGMTEVSSLTGRLLVAAPALADPNFDRAVVLLLDHDEEGSLGVVLNRPTPVGVADILLSWAGLAYEPGVVFQGGPVSLDSALGVAVIPGDEGPSPSSRSRSNRGTPRLPPGVRGDRPGGPGGAARAAGPGPRFAADLRRVRRLGAGAAGGGTLRGRLVRRRVGAGGRLVPAPGGPLEGRPAPKKRSELAMVATYPDDPSLN